MKIIIKYIKTGSGNDRYFNSLYEGLKKNGQDVEVISYPKFFQFAPFLLKLIDKKSEAAIIHSNIEYGWVFKEKNKPLVVTALHIVFDPAYQTHTSLLQKIFHNLILKRNIHRSLNVAAKTIAISNYTKKSLIATFGPHKIDVCYCGVDTEIYKPDKKAISPHKKFLLLFVGNLTRRKGVDLLPKILKQLGSGYELMFTSGLRSEIPDYLIGENLRPLGKLTQRELVHAYNTCDALLFPSRLEGFGYSIVEAMACKKPVIVSNNSSMPELVTDEKNGFLCRTDDVDDFVNKIQFINQLKKKGKLDFVKNREKVIKNFTIERMVVKCIAIYRNLIQRI